MATLGMSAADREAVEAFRRDVVEPSMTGLVILDFWAEWCGPCKQLGPVLEKVASAYADRGVKLVKIDVDKDKFIAGQFRVQSIPTVYALFHGQPVADLTQARTEAQVGRILDQLLAQLPVGSEAKDAAADVAQYIAMAEEVLAAGDAARALGILEQLAEMAPDDAAAIAVRVRALLALGRVDDAAALLATAPEGKAGDLAQARAAVALAQASGPAGEIAPLRAAADAAPQDPAAQFALGEALMGSDREGAADALLASIAADRTWEEGRAKEKLLTLFAAVGLEDSWVSAQRRRLSAILFT